MKFEKVSLDQFSEDIVLARTFGQNELEGDGKANFRQIKTSEYESLALPSRSTKNSAGYDFHCPFDVAIPEYGKIRIPLGIRCVGMPKKTVLLIFNRSGLSLVQRLTIDNSVGVIDSDFEKDIWIQMTNNTNEIVIIESGAKICQGIFLNYLICDDDKAFGSRKGGMGSTGK